MIHHESHELERFREKDAEVEESCLFLILSFFNHEYDEIRWI